MMKLNCKAGDLAVIVKSPNSPLAVGRFVTVLRRAFFGEIISGFRFYNPENFAGWLISSSSPIDWEGDFVMERAIFDEYLRPIRNEPGADETLSWCDVPTGVTA